MTSIVQILRSLRTMPPFPDVAARVMQIVRDPDHQRNDLVAVVRTDPALTTRILETCNSSLSGLACEVSSIDEAVTILGSRNLVKLVLVSCTGNYFRSLPANDYAEPGLLWQQTMACSTACQLLAERIRYEFPTAAFTAGILHGIGRVALLQAVDPRLLSEAARQLRDPSASPVEVERRVFGIDHAAAAGIVTEAWNLPTELRRAVRNHHDESMFDSDDRLTALLHTADELVMRLGTGDPQADRVHAPATVALRRLGLAAEDLVTVGRLVQAELARVGKLLAPRARPEPRADESGSRECRPARGRVKMPGLHVDACEPALAWMLGACSHARTAAVFAVPVPGLPERSHDLVLDRELSSLPHGSRICDTPANGQSRPRA